MRKYNYLFIFFFLPTFSFSQNMNYVFEEVRGDDKYYYYYTYKEHKNKIIINSNKTAGRDTLETQILTTDKNYNSKKWEYIRKSDNTHVVATSGVGKVVFRGKHDGDKIDEVFELDGYKWIQLFPMNPGLNQWIRSGEEEVRFWIIGNAGPADMEINKFVASMEGSEEISIMGKKIHSFEVEMTLSGWRSMFWSGTYYYSMEKLKVLKYDGDGAPGDSGSTTTLISETKNH